MKEITKFDEVVWPACLTTEETDESDPGESRYFEDWYESESRLRAAIQVCEFLGDQRMLGVSDKSGRSFAPGFFQRLKMEESQARSERI